LFDFGYGLSCPYVQPKIPRIHPAAIRIMDNHRLGGERTIWRRFHFWGIPIQFHINPLFHVFQVQFRCNQFGLADQLGYGLVTGQNFPLQIVNRGTHCGTILDENPNKQQLKSAARAIPNCAKSFVTRAGEGSGAKGYVAPKVGLPLGEWIKT